jgi:hypothetical protein
MLFMMGSQSHLGAAIGSLGLYWLLAFAIVAAVEWNALAASAPLHKTLTTVSGTLWFGFGLTLVFYLVRLLCG